MTKLADRVAQFTKRLADLDVDLQAQVADSVADPIETMPDPEPVESVQLGAVSPALRGQMGNALADVFDNFGPEIYNGVVLAIKEALKSAFEEGSNQIESAVEEELGARGIKAAQKHFRNWMTELTAVITQQGLSDAAISAADEASTLAAEFASEKSVSEAPDLPGLEDIENVPLEDVEVVEEQPAETEEAAAPAFENTEAEGEAGGEAGGEVPLEAIPAVGAGFPQPHITRRTPKTFKR
ncbi:MAG: hypothetical protein WC505_06720 [Patescibacteria group bacterium]